MDYGHHNPGPDTHVIGVEYVESIRANSSPRWDGVGDGRGGRYLRPRFSNVISIRITWRALLKLRLLDFIPELLIQ